MSGHQREIQQPTKGQGVATLPWVNTPGIQPFIGVYPCRDDLQRPGTYVSKAGLGAYQEVLR